jgi:hypothetical protein
MTPCMGPMASAAKLKLPARCEWTCRGSAADECDEVAPSQQNCPREQKPTKGQRCASQQNWSANDRFGGTSRPSASAVLRLTAMFELRWLQRWKFSRIFPFEHPSGVDADLESSNPLSRRTKSPDPFARSRRQSAQACCLGGSPSK